MAGANAVHITITKVALPGGAWLISLYDDDGISENYSAASSLAHAKRHALWLLEEDYGVTRSRLRWENNGDFHTATVVVDAEPKWSLS